MKSSNIWQVSNSYGTPGSRIMVPFWKSIESPSVGGEIPVNQWWKTSLDLSLEGFWQFLESLGRFYSDPSKWHWKPCWYLGSQTSYCCHWTENSSWSLPRESLLFQCADCLMTLMGTNTKSIETQKSYNLDSVSRVSTWFWQGWPKFITRHWKKDEFSPSSQDISTLWVWYAVDRVRPSPASWKTFRILILLVTLATRSSVARVQRSLNLQSVKLNLYV